MKGILPQTGIGAKITGRIRSMEHLVALASPVVPDAEEFLPRGIEIVDLIGIHVAEIENIVFRLQDGPCDLLLPRQQRPGPRQHVLRLHGLLRRKDRPGADEPVGELFR